MNKLYSYVLKHDCGSAPNPFWGICSLTICKPPIRRTAKIGDWVIGTGSAKTRVTKNKIVNLSDHIVYAMKVSGKKTLEEYDKYCNQELQNKIPKWKTKDWRKRLGDAIYDFSEDSKPKIRKSVHNETNRKTDMRGKFTLLSNHFYYFGLAAKKFDLKQLIKRGPGYKIIEQPDLILKFEKWINQFELNKIYADPQLRWMFDREDISDDIIAKCAQQDYDEDESSNKIC